MRAAETDAVTFLRHRSRVLLLLVILIGTTVQLLCACAESSAGFYLDDTSDRL